MWKILQELLPIVLIILVLSQYILPILLNQKTWWLFRREDKKQEIKKTIPTVLLEEVQIAKTYVADVKMKVDIVKEKIDDNLKTAEDLKKEADKLI